MGQPTQGPQAEGKPSVGMPVEVGGKDALGNVKELVVGTDGALLVMLAGGGNGIDLAITGNSTSGGAGYRTINVGTAILAGGDNITLSQDGQSITISGASGGGAAATGISSIVASDATYTSGKVVFSGVGAATVNSNTGQRVDISVAAQSVQIVQSALQGSDATYTSGKVIISGVGGGITVSSNTGQRIDLSVAAPVAQTAQTGISSVQASDATYTSGKVIFTGVGGGITVSSNTGQRVDLSVAAPVAQTVQTQHLHDVSLSTTAGGATAGTMALVSSGTITLYAGNNITLSQSGTNNIIISGPNTSAQQTFVSGISASNTNYTSGVVQFTGVGGGITVSSNTGQRVDLSVAAANSYKLHAWQNMPALDATSLTRLTAISKTPFYWPETVFGAMTPSSIALKMLWVLTSTQCSFSVHFGVYTFANSTSANLLGSGSDAFVVSSNSSASFSSVRNWVLTSPGTVAAISNLTPGNYLFGMMVSAAATASMDLNLMGASVASAGDVVGMVLPGTNQVSTGTSQGVKGLHGRGSTTVNVMPAAVSAADLVNQGTGASAPLHPYLFIRS